MRDDPRVVAYPVIPGRPPIVDGPPPPPNRDPERIKRLWSVRLDRVDASVREAWIMEYRWQGHGRGRSDLVQHPNLSISTCAGVCARGRCAAGRRTAATTARYRSRC